MEQRYHWANKVTGCILALFITLILSNLKVIPAESPVYDNVWGYVVPLAAPMLLFKANVTKIWKESGRVLIIYLLGGIGTIIDGFVAYFVLRAAIPHLASIAPMFVGTYTGGSVNFVAMSESFKVDGETVSAALVADNLLMALYFFALVAMPAIPFFRKKFNTPLIDKMEQSTEEEKSKNQTLAAKYWGEKEISLLDIAVNIDLGFTIVMISTGLANLFSSWIARNEIYTRHGRIFNDKSLLIYFRQFPWYQEKIPSDNFPESVLNSVEAHNRDTIINYERKKGWR